jgi:hypothetical protein
MLYKARDIGNMDWVRLVLLRLGEGGVVARYRSCGGHGAERSMSARDFRRRYVQLRGQ